MFSDTDIENRCESTVLNYTCDGFVPPDQCEVAHSQIFFDVVRLGFLFHYLVITEMHKLISNFCSF